jgi:hypothetical protein
MPGGRPKGDPNHQRRGNGAGWGGPAKGEGNAVKGIAGPGRGITGKSVAELMALQAAREIAADAWLAILNDPEHPKHAEMVAKAADRLDGAPVQPVDLSDKRAVVSAEPLTEDEWIASHGVAAAGRSAEGAG